MNFKLHTSKGDSDHDLVAHAAKWLMEYQPSEASVETIHGNNDVLQDEGGGWENYDSAIVALYIAVSGWPDTERIQGLMREANGFGDKEMVLICVRALGGDAGAIAVCGQEICSCLERQED